MLTLDSLQWKIASALSGPPDKALLDLICEDGLEPTARLSVYSNNILYRLTEALATTYPVVCSLVGREFFDYGTDRFIRQEMPAGGCLTHYGGSFASFLESLPAINEAPYLADVARLEWDVSRAVRSQPHSEVSASALIESLREAVHDGVDASMIGFRFSPSVRFLSSRYAIDTIWEAHHEGRDGISALTLVDAHAHLEIKGGSQLRIDNLPLAVWTFRKCLAGGEALEPAFSSATVLSPDFDCASEIAALLHDGSVLALRNTRG